MNYDLMPMKTKTIPAFKARCLAIMDEVQAKRGKPLAKLVPVDQEKDDIYGFFKGEATIKGDVVAPAFTPEEWGDLY
jgi:antitoxin (DNA-binding transcriptional repressor) of toxin-antitoxin stability system